jgi:hypothetical protein
MGSQVGTTSRGQPLKGGIKKKKGGSYGSRTHSSTTSPANKSDLDGFSGMPNTPGSQQLRETGSGLTPQENIKEKCPKCQTEVSAIKVSTTSRAVLFLCPSCGGKRSKILTKEGFKGEKEKFNYRYAPTSLYGKTFAAESKPAIETGY